MCGLVGMLDLRGERRIDQDILHRMTQTLVHRGPDSAGDFVEGDVGLGFRRLSIIDLESGDQPIFNEDHSLVLQCNGEIFNYLTLRRDLIERGHVFRTNSDVEVLLHLYEEEGVDFLNKLNGQFAFVIYDRRAGMLFLARDHCGVNPLYYTVADGVFIFASEIKAILVHPAVAREVDLTGLDQVLSFPGLVSPRTMFKGIESLPSGHLLTVKDGDIQRSEYWDLVYPTLDEASDPQSEDFYVNELAQLLRQSVEYRLQADVPVGFYLSGGLDSSLIAALIRQVSPEAKRHAFSIGFDETNREINEINYQQLVIDQVKSIHHTICFDWPEIADRLVDMVYHCECPVRETYNTCSMALSEATRKTGIPVILTGEGSDELFGGYIGYRFDQAGLRGEMGYDLEAALEDEIREKIWGDPDLFYEKTQYAHRETKQALYSDRLNACFSEFECLNFPLVNQNRLRNRHPLHQRSYLDFKLRLADHLLSDHGDRMALANSVEARYPFLDIDLINFATRIPPDLKLNQMSEKYIVKKVAEPYVPAEIIQREKFGFRAPGSPYLLQQQLEWVNDMLSYERIKRQGYFNPEVVERLKAQYAQPGTKINPHLEDDLLLIVLTFGILIDRFALPGLN